MAGSSLAGVFVGNWLVSEAPVVDESTRTNVGLNAEQVLDASGRPLAGVAPQPLTDGTLGVPKNEIQPMWEIQAISLFDSNLDPMVSLAIGNEGFTIADVLNQAGAGLGEGSSDIATLDITQGSNAGSGSDPVGDIARQQGNNNSASTAQTTRTGPPAGNWQQALDEAIRACDSVGFFSRPGCIEQARQRFCGPNNGWGRYRHCPSPQGFGPGGGGA